MSTSFFRKRKDFTSIENVFRKRWIRVDIIFIYQYAIQQTSQTLQLNADKSVTGALMGKWNWDADNKILSVGTQKLYVENGLDWESSSRVLTLQFSGINSVGWSVWGKKIIN